jgi:PAS domain S-box-containing protein
MNFYNFVRQTPALLLAVSADGILEEVSDRWLQTFGYERERVFGRSLAEFLAPALRKTVDRAPTSLWLAQTQSSEIECQFVRRDGELIDVLAMVTAQQAADALSPYLITLVDLSGRQNTARSLTTIAHQIAQASGEHFFRELVRNVARALDVRYALVTECSNQPSTQLRILAYIDGNDFLENFAYEVTGTPCAGVVAGAVCYYPQGLNRLFHMELAEESYLGVPLYDTQGNLVGHLAVLDDKPMQRTAREIAMVQFFAVRAGAEVERQRAALARLHQLPDWSEKRAVRTLHDSVVQSLYSLTLLTEGWRRMAQRGTLLEVDEAMAELGQISQEALREMYRLVGKLRPAELDRARSEESTSANGGEILGDGSASTTQELPTER